MPFPRSIRADTGKPGRMRDTFADSPKVGGHPGIPCRKGQAPSQRGRGCGFAQRCGKRGRGCAERRGRRSLPGRKRIRRRWWLVFAVAAPGAPGSARPITEVLRIRRMFVIISPLLPGRRDAAPYRVAVRFPFPSPSGGRWHPPIPREADDGRGRTRPLANGKSFANSRVRCHFHIALPPRSPSPAALVDGTLPRWGRERERALPCKPPPLIPPRDNTALLSSRWAGICSGPDRSS